MVFGLLGMAMPSMTSKSTTVQSPNLPYNYNTEDNAVKNTKTNTKLQSYIHNGNNNAIRRELLREQRSQIGTLQGNEKKKAQQEFNERPEIKAHAAEVKRAEEMAARGAEKLRLKRLAEAQASQAALGGSRRKKRKSKRKSRARKTRKAF